MRETSSSLDPASRPMTGFSTYTFMWLDLIDNATAPFASLDIVIEFEKPASTNGNAEFLKVEPTKVDYTMQISHGRGRHVGWGDLRPKSADLRAYEREYVLSVGRVRVKARRGGSLAGPGGGGWMRKSARAATT